MVDLEKNSIFLAGTADMKVKNYGFKKEFIDRYDVKEIMNENGITKEQIIKDILKCNIL